MFTIIVVVALNLVLILVMRQWPCNLAVWMQQCPVPLQQWTCRCGAEIWICFCSFVWRMMLVQIRVFFRTLNKLILLVVGFGFSMFLSTCKMLQTLKPLSSTFLLQSLVAMQASFPAELAGFALEPCQEGTMFPHWGWRNFCYHSVKPSDFPEESEAEPAASDGDQGGTGGAAAWGRRHHVFQGSSLLFVANAKINEKSLAKYHFPRGSWWFM